MRYLSTWQIQQYIYTSMNLCLYRYLKRHLKISQRYLYQSEIFGDTSKDISPYLKSLEISEP